MSPICTSLVGEQVQREREYNKAEHRLEHYLGTAETWGRMVAGTPEVVGGVRAASKTEQEVWTQEDTGTHSNLDRLPGMGQSLTWLHFSYFGLKK